MKTLHLVLKKKYYQQIDEGTKKQEYREKKAYWEKRLVGRNYDTITFQMGYAKDAPRMVFKYLGFTLTQRLFEITGQNVECFAIDIGDRIS